MKKNVKGYMLTETIIAITVVATIVTIIFASTVNYFLKKDNDITKYNTVQGLYTTRDIRKFFNDYENKYKQSLKLVDYIDITNNEYFLTRNLDIKKIYFTKKNLNKLLTNEKNIPTDLKKQIKMSQSENNEKNCQYNYLILFKRDDTKGKYTYVDNSYTIVGVDCYE